ncbi:hypothetical protein KBD33_05460, partial [Candidatus Gracilibacteria bacterium]|nr:hypothetical protein [Candidatus Gracilibacteria bacterium]
IPKIYPSYPAKKLNEKGSFFRNWGTRYGTGFSQIDPQEITDLVRKHTTHDAFFKEVCQKIFPCSNEGCHHGINDIRILGEKYDQNTPQYYTMQIWRCNTCGGILRFLWDEIGSCESDYGDGDASTSGDTRIHFDSKWNSKDIIKNIIIKEYIPEEVVHALYSADELWEKEHPITQ